MSNDAMKALMRDMAERGRPIEAGWMAYRATMLEQDTPDDEVFATRLAFFMGAQHLFTSIIACLDPGTEEMPGDTRRLNRISAELEKFVQSMLSKADDGQ